MTLDLAWWAYFVIWWAGMIVAAIYAGHAQRDVLKKEGKPYTDSAIIITVVVWPFILVVAPILAAFLVAVKPKSIAKKRADGKPE